MFKLSNYFFVKQEEAGSESASAGSEEAANNSDGQTVLTGEQGNTENQEDSTDIENTDKESDGKDETKNEDGSDKSDDDKAGDDGVPEKYDFTVPEGMELDEQLSEKFSGVAKELGLNNEQANKIVGMYAEQVQGMQEAHNETTKAAWDTQVADWETELKNDPEFGGANFAKNAETAKLAVNKFGGDELKTALNETGLGNHPAIVKFMHKVGLSISEDSFHVDGHDKGEKASTPQGLYSKSNMNP